MIFRFNDQDANNFSKIEQFIETLYPRQNAAKLSQENAQRQRKEPTTDPGEAMVLVGVAIACMIFMSLLMVSSTRMIANRALLKLTMITRLVLPGCSVPTSATSSRISFPARARTAGSRMFPRRPHPSPVMTNCNCINANLLKPHPPHIPPPHAFRDDARPNPFVFIPSTILFPREPFPFPHFQAYISGLHTQI